MEIYWGRELNNTHMGRKNTNYYYLIIIITITLFINKKSASYSD